MLRVVLELVRVIQQCDSLGLVDHCLHHFALASQHATATHFTHPWPQTLPTYKCINQNQIWGVQMGMLTFSRDGGHRASGISWSRTTHTPLPCILLKSLLASLKAGTVKARSPHTNFSNAISFITQHRSHISNLSVKSKDFRSWIYICRSYAPFCTQVWFVLIFGISKSPGVQQVHNSFIVMNWQLKGVER